MSKIPEISDKLLSLYWSRIRPLVKGPDERLWYIKEEGIDLRRTVFNRNPQLSRPAGRLESITIIPVATTLMLRATTPTPTIAEIFAQLAQPILREAPSMKEKIGSIGSFWVEPDEFTIDHKNDRMIIYVDLFKKGLPQ